MLEDLKPYDCRKGRILQNKFSELLKEKDFFIPRSSVCSSVSQSQSSQKLKQSSEKIMSFSNNSAQFEQ